MLDAIAEKKKLIRELEFYFKKLNSERLYTHPNHKETKDWLAEVAGIFKNLDESDYKAFQNHRQHLYAEMNRETRKHAAHQIEAFTREKVASWKRYRFEEIKESPTAYIRQGIIEGFIKKKDNFNYKKLIRLMTELNSDFVSGYPYSTSMLIRGILDHIPPLLNCSNFEEVANNYSWEKTDKKYMKALLDFKNEGDDALHRKISSKEDLLEMDNIPSSNRLNILLQECLNCVATPVSDKLIKQIEQKTPDKSIKIEIVKGENINWANYSQQFNVWSSFRIHLEIDNFNSKKPDYINVSLIGKKMDGSEWIAKHFNFPGVDKQDEEVRVEGEEVKRVHVFISDYKADSQTREEMPEIDDNGLFLIVMTKSGAEFKIPIPREKITRG